MNNPVISVTYKDLILRKLSQSVLCSIGSHILIFIGYVFFYNLSLFHPMEWIKSTITVFTSFSIWIFLFLFITVIFIQSIICSKGYIYRIPYSSTRFQKIINVFSMHYVMIFCLNMLVGTTSIWLFMNLNQQSHKQVFKSCSNKYCLNEESFYLILGGTWNGVYFFYRDHSSYDGILCPVICRRKVLRIKSGLLLLMKECCVMAAMSTFIFIVSYMILGNSFVDNFVEFFGIQRENYPIGYRIYLFLWLYGALYFFKMILMKQFFNLFLTEPVEFPLYKANATSFCLQESITLSNMPILQNLACLDLYNLSQWSKIRRQMFFTLSQPGGHPHNWNLLVENVLKLFTDYIEVLNNATESQEATLKKLPEIDKPTVKNIEIPKRFHNIRNMALPSDFQGNDVVELTRRPSPLFTWINKLLEKFKEKVKKIVSFARILLGIDYLFKKMPQADSQKLLDNGYIIIWTSQGIAELACASLSEDKYGIVLKDLPVIISTLVNLKNHLDKLNKMPALTRRVKVKSDFSSKMKAAVLAAVKRSLFNINNTFGNYIHELCLSKEVVNQLQIICKN